METIFERDIWWRIAVAEVSELVGDLLTPASTSVGQWMTLVIGFGVCQPNSADMPAPCVTHLPDDVGNSQTACRSNGAYHSREPCWHTVNTLVNSSKYVVSRGKTKRKIRKCLKKLILCINSKVIYHLQIRYPSLDLDTTFWIPSITFL